MGISIKTEVAGAIIGNENEPEEPPSLSVTEAMRPTVASVCKAGRLEHALKKATATTTAALTRITVCPPTTLTLTLFTLLLLLLLTFT
ncbi:MAG: hypothetical protein Q7T59_03180 [Candidatus Woesebacteria bacterium]|nr:hypothetical protein [Candidatus Woesebacteria bacterium]